MRTAICHYSFHRRYNAEGWSPLRLAQEVAALGVEGVDFHAGLLGGTDGAVEAIGDALAQTGRVLSGVSLSNNFNQEDGGALAQQIANVEHWMAVGAEVGAPVMRIFGGHVTDRTDAEAMAGAHQRVLDALGQVTRRAERLGVVLALENHGGLPCSASEQVEVIEAIGSPNLQATIDVGNYMACGQEAHEGTHVAAECCAYVHFKDFAKIPSAERPWGWTTRPATVGAGDIDHRACLLALREAAFDGFVALEYEGEDDESVGVPASVAYMNQVMAGF